MEDAVFEEESRVRHRDIELDRFWRIAFWVLVVLAGIASAIHALAF